MAGVVSSSRLGIVRRSPAFGFLFLATLGSGFGTYLAAIALTLHIKELTGSGVWVAALLIADFLPIVVIGMLLGPLVDRLSRRWLMVVSDLVRFGVFAALPFVSSPEAIVVLAGVSGIATGFFRPAAYAALPNLVPDDELTNANSLLQTIETLAWMIGPVVGGVMVAAWRPSLPYAVNAVTFLVSAALVGAIPERKMRSEESVTRGHWRDVSDGIKLVLTSAPLRTVLIVWNVVLIGSALINVAEVFFAQDTLDAGEVGFGVLVAASGVGLALGSFLAAPSLGKVGLRRHYAGSILLMAVGWGGAALTSWIWFAVPLVIAGARGNGAAIVANQILVQRGAPDRYRGRALATIMSSNYAILGLAMAGAGVGVELWELAPCGSRQAAVYLFGVLVALALTRWLPVSATDTDPMLGELGAEAARALDGEAGAAAVAGARAGARRRAGVRPGAAADAAAAFAPPEPENGHAPEPAFVAANGSSRESLDRLADLLEEIEERRELEARRSRS